MIKRNIFIVLIAIPLLGSLIVAPSVFAECPPTSVIECQGEGEAAIIGVIADVIWAFTGGVGLAAVGAIIYGGILYGASGDSPENIKKAKQIWMNTFIGILMFIFMVAVFNFIIPGGVF